MSERSHHRRPATFKLDDPGVIVMDPEDSSRPSRGTVHVTPEVEPAALPVPIETPVMRAQRGFRWGAVFWSATGGLILLGLGLGVARLIEDLFASSEGLGFVGLAFAFAATLAFAITGEISAKRFYFQLRRFGEKMLVGEVGVIPLEAKPIEQT